MLGESTVWQTHCTVCAVTGALLPGARIDWLGDRSEKGLPNGAGLMVHYVCGLDEIEHNHERLVNEGAVAASAAVRRLVRPPTGRKHGVRP